MQNTVKSKSGITLNVPQVPEVGDQRKPIWAKAERPEPGTRCYVMFLAPTENLKLVSY